MPSRLHRPHRRAVTTDMTAVTRTPSPSPARPEAAARQAEAAPPPSPVHALLDRSAAAAYLACSTATLDRRVRDGSIAAFKIAGRVRFRTADLDAFIGASRVNPPPPQSPPTSERDRDSGPQGDFEAGRRGWGDTDLTPRDRTT